MGVSAPLNHLTADSSEMETLKIIKFEGYLKDAKLIRNAVI